MRTPNCDRPPEERGGRKSGNSDVTDDVTDEVAGDESESNDGVCARRLKRHAESTATGNSAPKATKFSVDGDRASSLTKVLRRQTLAYQRHVMDVVQSGDVSELKRFLEQREGKLDVNFFDKDGQTALHHSCISGNFELVKLLVKFGADTRLANRDGWNPLHIATFGGHQDIVLYLIGAR